MAYKFLDCTHCLVCSSLVSSPEEEEDDVDQFNVFFLLATLLEIPLSEVVQQEKLLNQKVNTFYCESCKKLVVSAKKIHTEILELAQKFREIQQQIVFKVSVSTNNSSSTFNHVKLLRFCRNFLNKRKIFNK